MDNFKIIFVGGKYKLVFNGHTYAYSSSLGPGGFTWNCVINQCKAHVKTDKEKVSIIGGDYIHTHEKEKETSKRTTANARTSSSPSSIKKPSSTPGQTPKMSPGESPKTTTPVNNGLNASLQKERDAAIDIIATKQREKDQLEAELIECKNLVKDLQESLKTMEAAWDADRTELEQLRKKHAVSPASSTSESELSQNSLRKIKLSIVGDSHVHNLKHLLQKTFPANFDIECYAKSGACVNDLCTTDVRQHGPEDVVVLVVGTNDVCKTSWSSLETSFSKLIEKFKVCKLVVMLVPTRRNSAEFNTHIHSLNLKISNLLKKKGVTYVNPASVLKNVHYSRDNLHFNKAGKLSICQMFKACIINKKDFSTLTKPNITFTRNERAYNLRQYSKQSISNKHKSKSQALSVQQGSSINIQRPTHNSNIRYSGNVGGRYHANNTQFRGGVRKSKAGQERGRKNNTRFNNRVVYNSGFRGPAYYPLPPPFQSSYHGLGLDFYTPPPPHPTSYDYDYFCPEPYDYQPRSNMTRHKPRNTRRFF